jgi:hypothetical protein
MFCYVYYHLGWKTLSTSFRLYAHLVIYVEITGAETTTTSGSSSSSSHIGGMREIDGRPVADRQKGQHIKRKWSG